MTDTLFLNSGFTLTEEISSGAADFDSFFYDPSSPTPAYGANRHVTFDRDAMVGPCDIRDSIESRDDVLLYTTAPLDHDLTITGKSSVILYLSSNCIDTDICINLTDVYPDGRSIVLNRGIRRLRFRESYEDEILMFPGEIYPVEIELSSLAYTFKTDHAIRIVISGSAYPQFDANLNNGGAMYEEGDTVVALNKIFHDIDNPSALILSTNYTAVIEEENPVENSREQSRLISFPNPFNSQLHIMPSEHINPSSINTIRIYDLLGDCVGELLPDEYIFHATAEMQSGIYIVELLTDSDRIYEKIIYLK